MKRKFFVLLLLSLAAAVFAAGCSSGPGNNTGDDKDEPYSLVYKSVTITPGMPASEVIGKIGEDYEYFESASCAFEGLDKVYTFDDIEIYTYPDDGVDYIIYFALRKHMVTVGGGVTIGSSFDEITAEFGEEYELSGEENEGSVTYKCSGTYLKFLLRSSAAYYIEFGAIT